MNDIKHNNTNATNCQSKNWLKDGIQKMQNDRRRYLIFQTVEPIPPAYGEAINTEEDENGNSEIIGYNVLCPFCKKYESQITGTATEGHVLQSLCGKGFYRIFMDDARSDIVSKVLNGVSEVVL